MTSAPPPSPPYKFINFRNPILYLHTFLFTNIYCCTQFSYLHTLFNRWLHYHTFTIVLRLAHIVLMVVSIFLICPGIVNLNCVLNNLILFIFLLKFLLFQLPGHHKPPSILLYNMFSNPPLYEQGSPILEHPITIPLWAGGRICY